MSKDIKLCLNIIEELLVEIEHMENIIELFAIGFDNNTTDGNDYEMSSMYILGKMICQIREKQILGLSDLLEKMLKKSSSESFT